LASTTIWTRNYLGFVGAHFSLIAGAIGLDFLQGYIWQLKIAALGYGPYYTISYLEGLSAFMIMVDLFILWLAVRWSQSGRIVSLTWPALWFAGAVFVIVANNL